MGARRGSSRRRSGADPSPGVLQFDVASDLASIRPIQQQIVHAAEAHRYHPDALFALKLALEEALINAVKHGNRMDTSKRVRVEARVSPEAARIEIEDEGAGFRREQVPDPTLDDNLEKCSGRGILLIEAYMSDVHWSRSGRRLHMTRRNAPDSPA